MVRLRDHKDSNCDDQNGVHFDATDVGRGIAGPNLLKIESKRCLAALSSASIFGVSLRLRAREEFRHTYAREERPSQLPLEHASVIGQGAGYGNQRRDKEFKQLPR